MEKNMKRLLLIFTLFTFSAYGQDVPVPALKQSQPVLLKNGTIHIGDGRVIEKGSILFDNGIILDVGNFETKLSNIKEIDCAGKQIYPGIIAANTILGLDEIDAARPTLDYQETGGINPNVRTIVGYNTDSRIIPTVRSNGVLIAQIAPEGTAIGGTSSIVQLDAWNWEDAVYQMDDGLFVDWPSMTFSTAFYAPPLDVQKKNSETALNQICKAFEDARAYMTVKDAGKLTGVDQRWEAMVPVLKKTRSLFVRAYTAKQIEGAVALAKKYDVKMVLVGANDAGMLTALLKENHIPVVIENVHALPDRDDDDVDGPYKLAKILKDAGIKYCLSINSLNQAGANGPWSQQNLMFQAGNTAGYGLTKEEALMSITKNAAEILGIADRVGSLEKNKDATIIVSTGDVLDMRTSNVERAFIQGRAIDLGNKQKDLYKKFKAKYDSAKTN
jgi:imidazolonepropionase-like amidohydrolase